MTRAFAIAVALLLAAAPLDAAQAQSGRPGAKRQDQSERQPRISEIQAQGMAQSRAGDARFVRSRGLQGGSYVFIFEEGGRVFEISIPAY